MDIVHLRLQNQHLNQPTFTKTAAVVAWLGAVQAQDYPMAKWALGQRLKQGTDEAVESAFNQGEILRTHILRPTWHFVSPENIRWMLSLSAPRVKAFMGHYNRKLELTDEVFKKSNRLIEKTLRQHTYATRQELKKVLEVNGIKTDVQRLAHLMMWPELDGLICSGPRQGKQFSYCLLEERVAKAKQLSKDEALAKLAWLYFRSHGPAQLKDFSWWSGLSVKDAQTGLDFIKAKLVCEDNYWYVPEKLVINAPKALLLSIYDEYTIAYKDRSALGGERYVEKLITMGNALTAVMIFDGKIVGTWKRISKKNHVELLLNPFEKKSNSAFSKAAEQYAAFQQMPVRVLE